VKQRKEATSTGILLCVEMVWTWAAKKLSQFQRHFSLKGLFSFWNERSGL